ncbi:HNH endonuclease [Microbacterium sp. zg.Y1090]|uniref:HNH endonuclease n=1 Tax=Microbacterium wangruii TaxID=3049073 RepID=UPI00214CCA80|nr:MULTISPECIES: HNH endonuclease [unclassified Microbacterium]MCR2817316.1 HNH endonuclease [Microbacterium sp. zg.Y1090]WIM29196.1 HNH endonuclease [Microbacterium sp. zg-Y1090]
MRSAEEELAIRNDVFRWLDAAFIGGGGYEISRAELLNYSFRGERIPLLDTGRGIRNPATFRSTLSIMSGWKKNRYRDFEDENGWIEYSYRDEEAGDNLKLIRAFELRSPMVYFRAVREGYYFPYYPIVIAENDVVERKVRFPLDQGLGFLGDPLQYSSDQRRYAESVVRTRLHQPLFRARVLRAYENACTVCDLKHPELLDAAHIIGDTESHGVPHVTNGLAMCKMHHAAYDRFLLGITADYEVRIDRRLLDEVDGPMLRHGLQDMHGRTIRAPSNRKAWPARDLLAERFAQFSGR